MIFEVELKSISAIELLQSLKSCFHNIVMITEFFFYMEIKLAFKYSVNTVYVLYIYLYREKNHLK